MIKPETHCQTGCSPELRTSGSDTQSLSLHNRCVRSARPIGTTRVAFWKKRNDKAFSRLVTVRYGWLCRLQLLLLTTVTLMIMRLWIRVVASGGASGARPPSWNRCPPFHVWPSVSAYIQYCILKMLPPLLVFGHSFWFLAPPAAKSWRRACFEWALFKLKRKNEVQSNVKIRRHKFFNSYQIHKYKWIELKHFRHGRHK